MLRQCFHTSYREQTKEEARAFCHSRFVSSASGVLQLYD